MFARRLFIPSPSSALLLSIPLVFACGSRVNAQDFSLLLSNANATFSSPSQATLYSFSGTVTNLTSDSIIFYTGLNNAYDSAGDSLGSALVPDITLGPNETYTGDIFSVTVAANQAPGFYSKASNGTDSQLFSYDIDLTAGTVSDYFASPYSVTILPAAIPEASTTASFGLLLALGMGGVVIAARKKKAAVSV